VEGVAREVLYVLSPWSSIRDNEEQDVLKTEQLKLLIQEI
jgi:hypothetical protein